MSWPVAEPDPDIPGPVRRAGDPAKAGIGGNERDGIATTPGMITGNKRLMGAYKALH